VCEWPWGGDTCDCLMNETHPCPNDCSGHGVCECGTCECVFPFAPPDCACTVDPCPLGTDDTECGPNGVCVCNECDCEIGLTSVDFPCDCDTQAECPSGPAGNGTVCSGQGTCECGLCVCDPGFIGEACECPARCPLGADGADCSGISIVPCDCGVCTCPVGYSGLACECNETAPCPTGGLHGTNCSENGTTPNSCRHPHFYSRSHCCRSSDGCQSR
jgi:integrin beta 1